MLTNEVRQSRIAGEQDEFMIRTRLIHIILIIADCVIAAGCSNTKYLDW